ncbi:MAG: 2-phosphosulfolactate phosphatase [Longimicrobiales bacterium]
MRLDVFFTPGELGPELPGRVVVVDVLRATSTMVEALANGARALFPVATADDAARIAQNIGRDSVLLCGERKGLPIEGFDLGNSPAEFDGERVAELSLVMTTSNGTRAFLAVAERWAGPGDDGTGAILAGSLLNLSAAARALADGGGAAAIVCAGRDGRFGLDDALCAGALIRALEDAGADPVLNDAGAAARSLVGRRRRFVPALEETAAGRHLNDIGRAEDIAFCARVDRTDVVPRFRDRKITAE